MASIPADESQLCLTLENCFPLYVVMLGITVLSLIPASLALIALLVMHCFVEIPEEKLRLKEM